MKDWLMLEQIWSTCTAFQMYFRLDNGWVIKIGRGLDYFKQLDRFHIGFTDFDFRPCRSTTIDVFHKKELQQIKWVTDIVYAKRPYLSSIIHAYVHIYALYFTLIIIKREF